MFALVLLMVSSAIASSNYVGAERCKSCHASAYQVWSQTAHARAMDALDAKQKQETRCTICHSLTPDELEPQLAGVQCEACHGGGKYYSPVYVMKDKELARAVGLTVPNEQTCRRCHDTSAPNLEPFDYAKAWARIVHGK